MSDIRFQCPSCGQHIAALEETTGQEAACPTCGTGFMIGGDGEPGAEGKEPAGAEQSTGSGPPSDDTPIDEDAQPADVIADVGDSETAGANDSIPRPAKGQALGHMILSMVKAGAGEAGRAARLAKLKAQTEKLRRVDLHRAHLALGRKAYKAGLYAEAHQSAYDDVKAIEVDIDQKRGGVQADAHGTMVEKAKAKAISAKMAAEAEVLASKRNALLAAIGASVAENGEGAESIEHEFDAARGVQQRITEKSRGYSELVSDRSARDALAASVKIVRGTAAAGSTAAETTDVTGTSYKRTVLCVSLAVVFLLSLVVTVRSLRTLISYERPGESKQMTATLRAWGDLRSVQDRAQALSNEECATLSDPLSRWAFDLSSIDMRDVDPLLQEYVSALGKTLRKMGTIFDEIETEVSGLRTGTDALANFGALLGALSGYGSDIQRGAEDGELLFRLLGVNISNVRLAQLDSKYGQRVKVHFTAVCAILMYEQYVAVKLSERHGVEFYHPYVTNGRPTVELPAEVLRAIETR